MRPATQILPVTLPINRYILLGRNRGDDFRFIGLANLFEMRHRFVAVPHLADNILIAVDDFFHALFNRFQIVEMKRFLARKIVIKAVFNHRPDGHLRAGKKLLHRLGQHMRAVMAQKLNALIIRRRDDRHLGIGLDGARQINHLAIDFPSQRFFGQRLGNIGNKAQPVNRAVKLARCAVG